MATKLACDAYETIKDIHSYVVTVKRTDVPSGADILTELAADLSPRGFTRLMKLLRKGMSSAKHKAKVEEEQAE